MTLKLHVIFIIGHIRGELLFFAKKLEFFEKYISKSKRFKKNPLKIATFLHMVQVGSKKNIRFLIFFFPFMFLIAKFGLWMIVSLATEKNEKKMIVRVKTTLNC